jgi:hypothetical protein
MSKFKDEVRRELFRQKKILSGYLTAEDVMRPQQKDGGVPANVLYARQEIMLGVDHLSKLVKWVDGSKRGEVLEILSDIETILNNLVEGFKK